MQKSNDLRATRRLFDGEEHWSRRTELDFKDFMAAHSPSPRFEENGIIEADKVLGVSATGNATWLPESPLEKPWMVSDRHLEDLVKKWQREELERTTVAADPPIYTRVTSPSASCRPMLSASPGRCRSAGAARTSSTGRLPEGARLPTSVAPPRRPSEGASASKRAAVRCSEPKLLGVNSSPQLRLQATLAAPLPGEHDGLIEVNVYFHELSDRISLRVPTSLRVGPDLPLLPQDGHDADYVVHDVWVPRWLSSLKDFIEKATGIASERQRLFFRGVPLGRNSHTLHSYGIADGGTVMVRLADAAAARGGQVLLACSANIAARRAITEEQGRHKAASSHTAGRPGSGRLWAMPKWQPSAPLPYFTATRRGLCHNGDSNAPVHMFADYGPWRSDEADASFARIRRMPAFTQPARCA